MKIRNLKIFLAVVESGSISKAARQLYISQPSVSQAVAELERECGGRLFERLSHKLYLTDLGKQVLGHARHIIASMEEMERQIGNTAAVSRLKIGATVTIGTCVIGPLLKEFRRRQPGTDVQVLVENTKTIEQLLLESRLDLALVEGSVKSRELICRPMMSDQLILVCPPGHPFSGRKSVHLEELSQEPMVLREPGSGTRALFEQTMQNAGYPVVSQWVCNNSEAIKQAVADGFGLTVISRRLVERELREGRLAEVEIDGTCLIRSFQLVYHKNKYLSPAFRAFLTLCEIPEQEKQGMQ